MTQAQSMEGLEEAARVLAWDGDSLAVTDTSSPVFETLNKKRLSPSTANSMSGCLARWAVEQVFRGDGDPFGPAEMGTVGHAVFEDLFGLPIHKRTRETAEQLLQTVHERHTDLVIPGDPLTMAKWRDRIRILIAGLWDIEDPTAVRVLAREKQMGTSEIEGIPFNGFVDRLDLGDNGLKVIDYKTGKMKSQSDLRRFGDDQGEQQRMYALALQNLDGVLPESAWLYYTQFGKAREISLSAVALNKTKRAYVKAWDTLQSAVQTQRFSTLPSGLCAYCPLATVCPTANRDKKIEPKTDKYQIGERLALSQLEPSRSTVKRALQMTGAQMAADYISDMDAVGWPDDVSDEMLAEAPEVEDVPWNETGASGDAELPGEVEVDSSPASSAGDAVQGVPDPRDFLEESLSLLAHGEDDEFGVPALVQGQLDGHTTHSETIAGPSGGKDKDMSDDTKLIEDRPWVETVSNNLNPASYAATAVWGTVSLATEVIHEAGVPPTRARVRALANTFASLVAAEQHRLSRSTSMQDGLNTRLRGALRTVLTTVPVPFGGDREAWDAWYSKAGTRLSAISDLALELWSTGPVDTPYEALITETPVEEGSEESDDADNA